MFALDTLVRSAVHACIAIVSPDIDIDPHPQHFNKQPKTNTSTIESNITKSLNSSQDKGKDGFLIYFTCYYIYLIFQNSINLTNE